jgi:hypothetical protein
MLRHWVEGRKRKKRPCDNTEEVVGGVSNNKRAELLAALLPQARPMSVAAMALLSKWSSAGLWTGPSDHVDPQGPSRRRIPTVPRTGSGLNKIL